MAAHLSKGRCRSLYWPSVAIHADNDSVAMYEIVRRPDTWQNANHLHLIGLFLWFDILLHVWRTTGKEEVYYTWLYCPLHRCCPSSVREHHCADDRGSHCGGLGKWNQGKGLAVELAINIL